MVASTARYRLKVVLARIEDWGARPLDVASVACLRACLGDWALRLIPFRVLWRLWRILGTPSTRWPTSVWRSHRIWWWIGVGVHSAAGRNPSRWWARQSVAMDGCTWLAPTDVAAWLAMPGCLLATGGIHLFGWTLSDRRGRTEVGHAPLTPRSPRAPGGLVALVASIYLGVALACWSSLRLAWCWGWGCTR